MASLPKSTVSVVVPVYSGANYLAALTTQVAAIRERWSSDDAPLCLQELIFVDDAAIDASPAVIEELSNSYPWVRILHLSRNFGQHPATIAGLLHSAGDWVVTLDEDLQHPPERIEAMLEHAVVAGLDIVYAQPQTVTHESLLRDLGSRMLKRTVGLIAGNRHVQSFNSYRVLRGSIARGAASVCGYETYFDIALSWFSTRVGTLPMHLKDVRLIQGGRSGYSFFRLLSHARRLLMSTQVKWLRSAALLGAIATLVGFGLAGAILIRELLAPGSFGTRGWGSLMIVVLVIGGTGLLLSSALLEYVSMLALRAQGKPVFFTVDRSADVRIATYFTGKRR
jgi:polyisoprenyl-phosphate glycosyltransferase